MFDSKAEIGLNLPSPEGTKKIVVRFPSDAEFTTWRRKKKVTQKDLGRRSFQIEPSKPDAADLSLLNAIRLDKENGPAIDEAEASYIINKLAECEVAERPERNGSAYIIKMRVMGRLQVAHTLRIPSVKEMMDYERMRSAVTFGQYGQQEIRINLSASAELYDKLKQAVDGYKGDVSIMHKAEAINVLLQEIRAEQEDATDPEEDDEDQD